MRSSWESLQSLHDGQNRLREELGRQGESQSTIKGGLDWLISQYTSLQLSGSSTTRALPKTRPALPAPDDDDGDEDEEGDEEYDDDEDIEMCYGPSDQIRGYWRCNRCSWPSKKINITTAGLADWWTSISPLIGADELVSAPLRSITFIYLGFSDHLKN